MKSKKILITGATGFIGKNLTATLLQAGYTNLYLFDRENTQQQLEEWCTDAEFVFHLAGVNRPVDVKEFYEGNTDFSKNLLDTRLQKATKHLLWYLLQSRLCWTMTTAKARKWEKTFSLKTVTTQRLSHVSMVFSANGPDQTTTQLWLHLCIMLHTVCHCRLTTLTEN